MLHKCIWGSLHLLTLYKWFTSKHTFNNFFKRSRFKTYITIKKTGTYKFHHICTKLTHKFNHMCIKLTYKFNHTCTKLIYKFNHMYTKLTYKFNHMYLKINMQIQPHVHQINIQIQPHVHQINIQLQPHVHQINNYRSSGNLQNMHHFNLFSFATEKFTNPPPPQKKKLPFQEPIWAAAVHVR
jgi:hypothetical protein